MSCKIFIKTLSGKQFPLEVDLDGTVAAAKAKIREDPQFAETGLKLLFNGKVLEDESVLGSYDIKESSVVILMATKPRAGAAGGAAASPARAGEKEKESEKEAEESRKQQAASGGEKEEEEGGAEGEKAGAGGGYDPSRLVHGSEYEGTLANIVEMTGCSRDEAVAAMKAAYNNPDRAVEYIFSGIPNVPDHGPPAGGGGAGGGGGVGVGAGAGAGAGGAPGAGAGGVAAAGAGAGGAPGVGAGGGAPPGNVNWGALAESLGAQPQQSPLEQALRSSPEFETVRAMVAQNPQLLNAFLQQLQQQSPELFTMIQQNPQDFMNILRGGGGAGGGGGGGGGGNVIRVTQEENDAIERLASFGFPKEIAAEAYFACDKNEELAANYLFENGADLMAEDAEEGDGDEGDEGDGGEGN